MQKNKVSWWSPDKIIKDLIWNDLVFASKYSKGKLLDIGCGNKPYKSIFEKKIDSYIGIDKEGEYADIKEDFLKIVFKESSFETILLTQVLEHVNNPVVFLKKVNKVLKKDGVLIMTVPFVGSLHEVPNDYYRFTKYAILDILQKTRFKTILIKEEGNWLLSISNLICFYLEATLNRFLLRYPKKVLQLIVQFSFFFLSLLPSRFTKPDLCPINYLVIAKKI